MNGDHNMNEKHDGVTFQYEYPLEKLIIGGQQAEPKITFHPGDQPKEVMRIDRHGVKVNPEYSVDEATQYVLNALTGHIQHTVNHAIFAERQRIVNLLMIQHEAANGAHNYWHVAANLIQADVASNT
jgi:hypothetical protein